MRLAVSCLTCALHPAGARQGEGARLRLLGACTDQPKSAIFSSPFMPSSRFSGLMSRWMTCFEWQYTRARASDAMYLRRV